MATHAAHRHKIQRRNINKEADNQVRKQERQDFRREGFNVRIRPRKMESTIGH